MYLLRSHHTVRVETMMMRRRGMKGRISAKVGLSDIMQTYPITATSWHEAVNLLTI